jgi:hypothetical protein
LIISIKHTILNRDNRYILYNISKHFKNFDILSYHNKEFNNSLNILLLFNNKLDLYDYTYNFTSFNKLFDIFYHKLIINCYYSIYNINYIKNNTSKLDLISSLINKNQYYSKLFYTYIINNIILYDTYLLIDTFISIYNSYNYKIYNYDLYFYLVIDKDIKIKYNNKINIKINILKNNIENIEKIIDRSLYIIDNNLLITKKWLYYYELFYNTQLFINFIDSNLNVFYFGDFNNDLENGINLLVFGGLPSEMQTFDLSLGTALFEHRYNGFIRNARVSNCSAKFSRLEVVNSNNLRFITETIDYCLTKPCLNGGVCLTVTDSVDNYKCDCSFTNYEGKNCDKSKFKIHVVV